MRRLWLALLLLGCTGDLDPAYRLERVRVLAVQTTVEGTARRATPMPGESATVQWLVVDGTGGERSVRWWMRVCADEGCAVAIAEGEGSGPPELTFVVPADVSATLHVEGIGCAAGDPPASPLDHCVGAEELPEVVEASIAIAEGPDEWNDNPDPAAFALTIDGQPWLEAEPDCALPEAQPAIAAEESVAIAFAIDEAERAPSAPFVLSHFVTEGDLDARFAVLEPDEPSATLDLPWTPSLELTGPRAVTHLFVARDGLGGVAWARRVVCVR